MRKQVRSKSVIWVVVVLAMFLIGTSMLLYQEQQADEQAYQRLLNHFYMEVEKSLHITSLISENDTADDAYMDRLFINLEVSLNNMTTLLDFAEIAVDDTNFPNGDFAVIAAYTDVDDYGKEAYVVHLQEILMGVKSAMYSEEHNQEDPNLTTEAFNTIVKEATDQASAFFN
ncbi:hypothetical protein DES38_104248 [Streptohalobacillus salinus]|uniref:Uncharacterized protein n=1 Tax=Streptohalobacillus salinus TaxID=621096 RepID=A0A2V3WBH9_9BACI|nr:hypothetical protein [Streptohalobacillus salinus]PXW91813.1 hypothetical protein DES38_104248 [Streptohalobacillus salinus]